MNKELLQKYADFAVKIGVNPQKGQTMIISAQVNSAEFARMCAKAAYEAGAANVVVFYADEELSRIQFEKADISVLEDIKPWTVNRFLEYIESEGSACMLSISSTNPEIYKGLDTQKVDRALLAASKAAKAWRHYTMHDLVQWCIVAIPSPVWAKKVFPNDENAVEKLWSTIFDVCRVTGGNPVSEWKTHVANTTARKDKLNAMQLDYLHLKSENGTDLKIGLAQKAIWEGAQSVTPQGYKFIANVPTEEVFSAPDCNRVDGVVKGTKPYVYNGNLIENFTVWFEKGRVVKHTADKGEELLTQLLSADEGARSIGEIALVPFSSPINKCNVLFYNTLFDENATCHIAFGDGYPGTIEGGTKMSQDELSALGVNHSVIHEDVMIGSADMSIKGYDKQGKEYILFENGEWAI